MSSPITGTVFSTSDVSPRERPVWLREVIGREYADVEITPPGDGSLFNRMTIYPWEDLRLSAIASGPIGIERLRREPRLPSQDAYFAVILLSGDYWLEQDGREIRLLPGDMAVYDAARPHRIHCPGDFTKAIVSIPRPRLRERVAGIEHCTALRIRGDAGIGAMASGFVRQALGHIGDLREAEFSALSQQALDLLTLATVSVRPGGFNLSGSRAVTIARIKDYIGSHLADPELSASAVAQGVGLSPRHINALFQDEGTSLMRHVLKRRLDQCGKALRAPAHAGHNISDIAFAWGFNDLSHFSRAFKHRFGCSPREYRKRSGGI